MCCAEGEGRKEVKYMEESDREGGGKATATATSTATAGINFGLVTVGYICIKAEGTIETERNR